MVSFFPKKKPSSDLTAPCIFVMGEFFAQKEKRCHEYGNYWQLT
jgi:hypothetical protein